MGEFIVAVSVIIVVFAIVVILLTLALEHISDKRSLQKIKMNNSIYPSAKDIDMIEYSTKMLDFVKTLTSEISVLKFRSFTDSHEIKMITKANIQKLVAEVAETVNKSINSDTINFDDVLFTKEFYENYIIETSLIIIKNLLNKTINGDE